MKDFERIRDKQQKSADRIGLVMTVVVHAALVVFFVLNSVSYLDPPPPEHSFLLDFTMEEEPEVKPVRSLIGQEPQAEEINPDKPVELVQQAQSPYPHADAPNNTQQSAPDNFGDVEVPKVEEETPQLDVRASFPGMSKKPSESTTPHSAQEESAQFKAGQADGNTDKGKTEGSASAKVKGRKVIGTLPLPNYVSQKEGIVVVNIKINAYGNVTEATAGGDGTTATDPALWNEARKAAMKAVFSQDSTNPVTEGTITYIFKLQ